MATIGFIGLGIMGAHMARNLLKGNHQLVVNGAFPVPDGTTPLAGRANQFQLPTGEIIAVDQRSSSPAAVCA